MDEELTQRLQEIAEDLRAGQRSPRPTVREFLAWIDAQRRGIWIVDRLRRTLAEAGLRTEPDFESAYLDSAIRFELAGAGDRDGPADHEKVASAPEPDEAQVEERVLAEIIDDPTYRLSKLAAANTPPLFVRPDDTLECAVTHMLTNDFSQLPVMTTERDVKGVISWKSVGARLATGRPRGLVREVMDSYVDVNRDISLFNVIGPIAQHDYVLVRDKTRKVTGIVTASDLSQQFRNLTEPFLLLSEIENHIRRIIASRYQLPDLQAAVDPDGGPREVVGVADLNFGEYVRLLQNPDQWRKLNATIDRSVFVDRLDEVRKIRNDVMHFDPDGIPDSDLEKLRVFARLLQRLQAMGVV